MGARRRRGFSPAAAARHQSSSQRMRGKIQGFIYPGVYLSGSLSIQNPGVYPSIPKFRECVVVRCNALQCDAVQCSAMQCETVRCSALQCVAVRCSALQCDAVRCSWQPFLHVPAASQHMEPAIPAPTLVCLTQTSNTSTCQTQRRRRMQPWRTRVGVQRVPVAGGAHGGVLQEPLHLEVCKLKGRGGVV